MAWAYPPLYAHAQSTAYVVSMLGHVPPAIHQFTRNSNSRSYRYLVQSRWSVTPQLESYRL